MTEGAGREETGRPLRTTGPRPRGCRAGARFSCSFVHAPEHACSERRRTRAVLGLTAPAYLWLTIAVFLPLSAMLYFSFLTVARLAGARRRSA